MSVRLTNYHKLIAQVWYNLVALIDHTSEQVYQTPEKNNNNKGSRKNNLLTVTIQTLLEWTKKTFSNK